MTATIYVTFGVQYGTPAECARYGKIPHPCGDWITGNGYLRVDYNPDASIFKEVDSYGKPLGTPRDRAMQAVFAWLGGRYAFDYNDEPSREHAPAGEIGRMVLP